MNTLVLGSTGMLGHKMLDRLRLRRANVFGLSREDGLSVYNPEVTEEMITKIRPHVVINCVGYIKQRGSDESEAVRVNTWFPHWLQRLCERIDSRLIHFSTDCVFSGVKGGYTEHDLPDAEDVYGYTKFMGEVLAPNAMTIRTSIIGRELSGYRGLLEWFLHKTERDVIYGHGNAIWSGVTTNWLADTVGFLTDDFRWRSGLYHIAGEAISKYDLLRVLRDVYSKKVDSIIRVERPVIDRSLNGSRFFERTGIDVPFQRYMLLTQLQQDKGRYDSGR